MISIDSLFDLSHSIAGELLQMDQQPWEVLPHISEIIYALGEKLDPEIYDHPGDGIWIARDATVAPSAYLGGPVIVDCGAEIRHCAFVRGKLALLDPCPNGIFA